MEQQGAKPVDGVRRDISGAGSIGAVGQAAKLVTASRKPPPQKVATAKPQAPADQANEFELDLTKLVASRQSKIERVVAKANKRQERREKAMDVILRQKPDQPTGILGGLRKGTLNPAMDAFSQVYEHARRLADQAGALRGNVSKAVAGVRSWALDQMERKHPGLHAQVVAHRTAEHLAGFKRQEAEREKSRGKDRGKVR